MWPRKNRCPNCNAPRAEGSTGCTYCELGAPGAPGSSSANGTPRRTFGSVVKITLGLVTLLCCAPLSAVVALHETVYAVKMEAPKYSAQLTPMDQRPTEPLTPMQVFLEMRDTDDRSLKQRKQGWRQKLEGRWVSWKGRVEEINTFEGYASEVVIRPEADQKFKVQVNFDPLHNARLKQLQVGQEVHVSGRLWGYHFMGDTARLSEGALVEPPAPSQVQEQPR